MHHSFNVETQTALHSITVWSKTQGLVLSQRKSEGKKNEQAGVLEILESFCLKNAIISVDAMNTQKKIAEKIKEKKADYVMPLKNNHRTFKEEIEAYFHKMERDIPHKKSIVLKKWMVNVAELMSVIIKPCRLIKNGWKNQRNGWE